MPIDRATVVVASLFLGSALAAAPPVLSDQDTLETGPDGPHIAPLTLRTGPAANVTLGQNTSIQVNVNDAGDNIIDDAANEPSIAVDPSAPNRMVVGWRQFDTITSSFRQAGYSYSRDGGRTWAGERIIEPGVFRSDPVLGAGPDGTFYYLSLRVTQQSEFLCDMFVSTDGGETWPSQSFAFGGDKAWFSIDPVNENFYQAWNTAGNEFFPNQFNRSMPGGATWEDPIEYEPGGNPAARPVFGLCDIGPDGAVYVAGAQNSNNTNVFWLVKSSDAADFGGIPLFEQITDLDLGGNLRIGTGPNPAGLLGQVEVEVDSSGTDTNNNVYVLCSVDPPGPDPMDVHFIRSEDGGATFSAPVRVNDDPGTSAWQWFGAMDVAPNGRIDAIWNDTRIDALGVASQLYYSFSEDGGVTWSPNEPLSGQFSSSVGWPQQSKLGDYYDIVSDATGAHVIYAATFNGEQDVYYLRIGDYDCNGNGIDDSADLDAGDAADCNRNLIPDSCEIAAGELTDADGDGVPDECAASCPWDINADGVVGPPDLAQLLQLWGTDDSGADFNNDGDVGPPDLAAMLENWGLCP